MFEERVGGGGDDRRNRFVTTVLSAARSVPRRVKRKPKSVK
jgi:hypothetical protein